MIIKLSINNIGKQTIRTSLGPLWVYIHDILYFSVFILFRILLAGNGKIEGMNNLVYLITGLVPWFFISEVLNLGTLGIKNNSDIIKSIKFPISIIPTIEVIAIFLKRIFTFILIFLVIVYFGEISKFNIFLFTYYMLCMFILMWVINLLISPFVAISADFNQIYLALNRVLMYTLPVIWSFETITKYKLLSIALKVNPMVYVINGFRNTFVLGGFPNIMYTLYFWTCILIIFFIGSFVQYKLRKYYSDFM